MTCNSITLRKQAKARPRNSSYSGAPWRYILGQEMLQLNIAQPMTAHCPTPAFASLKEFRLEEQEALRWLMSRNEIEPAHPFMIKDSRPLLRAIANTVYPSLEKKLFLSMFCVIENEDCHCFIDGTQKTPSWHDGVWDNHLECIHHFAVLHEGIGLCMWRASNPQCYPLFAICWLVRQGMWKEGWIFVWSSQVLHIWHSVSDCLALD